MIAAGRVALVLLAAGRSTRFGQEDKLTVPLVGTPLALHAARTFAAIPFAAHVAVVAGEVAGLLPAPFASVVNDYPAAGQARSIRLGVAEARRSGCAAILIALADMPFVSAAHIAALLEHYSGPGSIVASGTDDIRSPPALFGEAWFDRLEYLSGDRGAGALLGDANLVSAAPRELADIDTVGELAAAAAMENG